MTEPFITLYEVDQLAKECDLTRHEVLLNLFAQGWDQWMSTLASREAANLYLEMPHE